MHVQSCVLYTEQVVSQTAASVVQTSGAAGNIADEIAGTVIMGMIDVGEDTEALTGNELELNSDADKDDAADIGISEKGAVAELEDDISIDGDSDSIDAFIFGITTYDATAITNPIVNPV